MLAPTDYISDLPALTLLTQCSESCPDTDHHLRDLKFWCGVWGGKGRNCSQLSWDMRPEDDLGKGSEI